MAASKTYEFEYKGTKYSIPAFSALPMGAVRKARKAKDEADQAFTILEAVMPEDSPELNAVDSMDAEAFNAWLTGWTQGAPLGESSSSEK
jgi:hypothetical protein